MNRDDPWGARKALQPVLAIIGPLARIARSDNDQDTRERQVRALLTEWTADTQPETEAGVRRLLRGARPLFAPPLDTWCRDLDHKGRPWRSRQHRGLGRWHLSAGMAEPPPQPDYLWHAVLTRCHKRNALTVRDRELDRLEQSSARPDAADCCALCQAIADGERRPVWPKVGAR